MTTIIRIKQAKIERGSSLLEVMIALFVLGIGLLGTLAMQTESMKQNQNSYAFSQSVILANDLAERLRANSAAADTDVEISSWKEIVVSQVPGGEGSVTARDANGNRTIKVVFQDSKPKGGTMAGAQTFELKVRI